MVLLPATAVRGLFVLAGAVLCVLPWVLSPFSLSQLGPVFYTTVAILSLTVAQGLAGQFSIGQAAFMGLGAYISGILVVEYYWSYAAAGAVAVATTGIVAGLLSIPSLGLRGIHVVMVTLGIGLVFPAFVHRFSDLTGGTAGLPVFVPLPMPTVGDLRPDVVRYFVLLVLTAATMLVVRNLKASRAGRALVAVRDHQLVGESLGVSAVKMKVISFGLSGAIAGLAGVMFTIDRQFVSPGDFSLAQSINLFIGLAVAGPVSVGGTFIGALFLQFTSTVIGWFGADPRWTPLILGLVLLAITYFLRGGVGSLIAARQKSVVGGTRRPQESGVGGPRSSEVSDGTALINSRQGDNG